MTSINEYDYTHIAGSNNMGDTMAFPLLSPKPSSSMLIDNPRATEEKPDLTIPRRPRKPLDLMPLLVFFGDLVIAALALYFTAFAIISYRYDGHALDGTLLVNLLIEGSRLGPTFFTIVFAAIVGRCLTSIASWLLQRGTSFLSLEQLLGSRTVSTAMLIGPATLRVVNWTTLMLFILWSFSPIGSQAAQRVIFVAPPFNSTDAVYRYLNVTASQFLYSEWQYYGPTTLAGFQAALLSPPQDKNSSQDLFGNVKIPLLENLGELSPGEKWTDVSANSTLAYSSLTGVPVNRSSAGTNSDYSIETSYILATCNVLPAVRYNDSISLSSDDVVGNDHLVMNIDATHGLNSTKPRNIILSSLVDNDMDDYYWLSNQTCNLTTSYVEVHIQCRGSSCAASRLRQSTQPMTPPYITALDLSDPWDVNYFFGSLLNSTGEQIDDFNVPLIQYFRNPDYPFGVGGWDGQGLWYILSEIGPTEFSLSLTQLINTWHLWSIAPLLVSVGNGSGSGLNTTIAHITQSDDVLNCSLPWFAVLIFCSLVMFVAGLLTAILNLRRQGPDVIDSFTGLTTTSMLGNIRTQSSLDDGSERARQLRNERIRIGDTKPTEKDGHVGIASITGSNAVRRFSRFRNFE